MIRKEKLNHHSDEQEESKQLRLPLSRFQWVMVFLNYLHLWVRHISSGGQTMNPSTEDIVKVIEQSQCKRAIILPNNKNIRMSSDQATTFS